MVLHTNAGKYQRLAVLRRYNASLPWNAVRARYGSQLETRSAARSAKEAE
jgi:hypothetical protein